MQFTLLSIGIGLGLMSPSYVDKCLSSISVSLLMVLAPRAQGLLEASQNQHDEIK